jgi:outer membrane protein assembly factor BamA
VLKQTGGDQKGLLTRLEISRAMSASSTLKLRLGREFSDQGNSFRFQQGIGQVNLQTQAVGQTTDPFTSKYAGLGWEFQRQRTGLGLNVTHFDESYRAQTLFDRTRLIADARASRNLTPNLQLQLTGTYDKEDFKNVPGDYREIGGSVALNWKLGRFLSLVLEYDRFNRTSDLPGAGYKENRGWLRVRYGDGNVRTSVQPQTSPSAPTRPVRS